MTSASDEALCAQFDVDSIAFRAARDFADATVALPPSGGTDLAREARWEDAYARGREKFIGELAGALTLAATTGAIAPETTPTGIPIVDCETCGKRHPETRVHCPVCGMANLFGHSRCVTPDNPQCACGHAALEHHGMDSRERPDAGCMGAGSSSGWCHCARTCDQVRTGTNETGSEG